MAGETERLRDDGNGLIHVSNSRRAIMCTGCRRPVEHLSELRGQCDMCRARGTCSHCETQCQVCAKKLCGRCRRGFSGPPPMTACVACLPGLIRRRAYMDRLRAQQAMFQRAAMRDQRRLRHRQFGLQAARQRFQARLARARERTRMITQLLRGRRRGPWYLP